MAKATADQVRKLEIAHKTQFVLLAHSTKAWIDKVKKSPSFAKTDASKTYVEKVSQLIGSWVVRNRELRKAPNGNVEFVDFSGGDFFNDSSRAKIDAVVATFLGTGVNGMGLLPLIVWAVVAIIGLFTAEKIVDETNNTATEQADLIRANSEFVKSAGLSPEQAAALTKVQNEAQAEGGITGGVNKLLNTGLKIAGVGILAIGVKKLGDNFGWWGKKK